jgi:TetR/AcrR family transcriptional repressor of nem operon
MPRPATRDRLLQAGLALIHRQGFTATGVQHITAAAAVPKGSFYNHFPSKEALGVAVLQAYWAAIEDALVPLADTALAPCARIHAHFAAVRDLLRRNGDASGCLLGNLAAEATPLSEPIRAEVAARFANWAALLAAPIEAGLADGSLRPAAPPAELAGLLVAAWEGTVQRAKVERTEAGYDGFLAGLDRLLGCRAIGTD